MSEFDELLQIAVAASQEATPVAEKPTEAAPPEPAQTIEQTPGAAGAGKEPGTAEVAAVEAKPEEKKPEPPKPEPKKTDWKAAASAEREKQRSREASKSKAAQLEHQVASMKQQLARYEELERLKETDPLAAMEKFGVSYDLATKKYIEQIDKKPGEQTPQVAPEIKTLIQNFQAVQGELQTLKQELANERRQKIVAGFDADAKAILEAKADDFELTRTAEEGPALVRAIVAAHWKKTAVFEQGQLVQDGETLPTEEACRLAEEYFEQKQLKRFAATKKFKALASPEPPKPSPTPQQAKGTTTTLSQSLLQSGGGTPSFSDEFEELAAMAKRLEAQQGN